MEKPRYEVPSWRDLHGDQFVAVILSEEFLFFFFLRNICLWNIHVSCDPNTPQNFRQRQSELQENETLNIVLKYTSSTQEGWFTEEKN